MVDWAELGLENPYTVVFLSMGLEILLRNINELKKKTVSFGWTQSDKNIVYNIREQYKSYFEIRKEVFNRG